MKARVTRIELDTLGRMSVEITVERQPSYAHTEEPLVSDIPADIREALRSWLDGAS